MKKNYITPEINEIQLEALCNESIVKASVFRGSTTGKCISNFEVVNESRTAISGAMTDTIVCYRNR